MSTQVVNPPSDRKWLGPVMRLGWISLFADIASEMAYPVIPLFVVNALKAPIEALGFIEGTAEALVSFMKGWSGWHSDRTGRRVPFVRWGYGLSAIGKPILAAAPVWGVVLFGRLTDRFGKGIRTTARDALIADSAGKENLGKAYGLHRGMDTAGAFIGVGVLLILLLIGHVYRLGDNTLYRIVFAAAAIPGLVSLALTFTLREPAVAPEAPAVRHPTLRGIPSAYWRALVLAFLFALANSSDTFLLLRSNQEGLSIIQVCLAYLLYNAVYTAVSYPAGALSDRIGRWGILTVGWTVYALVYAGFAGFGGVSLWVLFAFYGCYIGLTDGVMKALVASHAPAQSRGTALGAFFMATGLATWLGNMLSGILWKHYGPRATFSTCAVIAFAVVLLIPLTSMFVREEKTVPTV